MTEAGTRGHPGLRNRTTAHRIAAAQLAAATVISTGLLVFSGLRPAWSALVGGLIGVAANLYFARRVFAPVHRTARQFLRAFYAGEAVKMLITAALFVLAIAVFEAAFLPLFLAYAATLVVHRFALLPGRSRISMAP